MHKGFVMVVIMVVVMIIILALLLPRLSSRSSDSVDCIVAACENEKDIQHTKNVIREVYGNDVRFFVYDKCGKTDKYLKLPNVGREQHTYTYHTHRYYDNLAQTVIFTPANINTHRPARETMLRDKKEGFHCSWNPNTTLGQIKNWTLEEYSGRLLDVAKPKGIEAWSKQHIGFYGTDDVRVCSHGVFKTTRELIHKTPRDVFERITKELSFEEPEAIHYLERVAPLLFGGLSPQQKA